jgi:histidinol phosphatase-like PHP family hydrolase
VDHTNIERVVTSILKLKEKLPYHEGVTIIPGVEITHCPARYIKAMVTFARGLGIRYVVVHGETIAEPVREGTNLSAIEAGETYLHTLD